LAVAGGRFVLLNFGRAADVLRLQTATERLAAYSVGSVAAFWLIERTLSFYVF